MSDAVLRVPDDGPAIGTVDDALDLIGQTWGTAVSTVVVPVGRLHPDFLVLSTRMLGEFTQKFVQYGKRLVLLGDLGARAAPGTPLADYVRETNEGDHVWIVPNETALAARLG